MPTNILVLPLASAPIAIANNEDWLDSVIFVDEDEIAISLVGIEFTFTVRRVVADTNLLLTGGTVAGTMLNGGATGILSWRVPVETMLNAIPFGPNVYDVRAHADGFVRRVIAGSLQFEQGVDR
jgi:hypothetical protein